MFPLLPPPCHRLRGGGRRGNGAQTAREHLIFMENPPGAALLPESARNRMVATAAAQRLPARGLPQCGHCPQGTPASIGASYALMMHKRSLASMYLARRTKRPTITPSPTRFGNGLKPAIVHVRGNRTHRPYHTRARIVKLSPVTARGLGPHNRGILRRSPHRQTLTIARLNHPDTRNRATRYDLVHPARDRLHEAQRPQASAAAPLGGPACAYKPNSDYRKRSTPPPARSRHPPVHTISDSDSMVLLTVLAATQGSSPSGRYSPGTPPAQRPRIPGVSTRLLRVEAGFQKGDFLASLAPQLVLVALSSLRFSSTTGLRAFAMGSPLRVESALFADALDRNEDSF